MLIRNLEKDLTLEVMQQRKNSKKYTSIEGTLSANTLDKMRLLSESKRDDSTFVHLFLSDIYGATLRNKTISSCNRPKNKGTSEIPTELIDKLKAIFEERLANISTGEKEPRTSSLSKCIRNAIDKAKRTQCDVVQHSKVNV